MRSRKFWSVVLTVLVLSSLLLTATAFAASGKDTPPPTVDVSEPVTPKLSPVMRELPYVAPEPRLNREEINPIKNPGLFLPDLGRTGTDTKAKDALVAKGLNALNAPSPLISFDGQGDFGLVTPPDTTGDVGPNHFVQMANLSTAIYSKSGTLITQFANNQLWDGYGGPCESDNNGDPIVLYDDLADRWLLSQFAVESGLYMCFAVSTTNDPTGSYYLYGFSMPDFPDYPKIGIWPDGYYLGTNTGYPNQYYAHVFNRVAMLAGAAATRQSVGGQANFLMPADVDGSLPPAAGEPEVFYTFFDGGYPNHPAGVDRIAIYEYDVDWVTPANTTLSLVQQIPIADFNYTICGFFAGDCVPQPGTAQRLDGVDGWPMVRLQYRNFGVRESMVGNFTVDVDGANHGGIRWFELRRNAGDWTLEQEGTYAPDAEHRWMGSIAMDGSGNIALGYSVSGTSTIPSIRYTVHETGDAPGSMQAEATLITGGGVQTGPYDRWGDYSAMVVDPTDNCTFWLTNEYHDQNDVSFMWDTRIGAFRIPSCTGSLGPTGTLSGTVTNASTLAPIADATVAATLSLTQTFTTNTDANGNYDAVLAEGTYTVTASAFGYQPATVSDVDVVSGTITTQNFALAPADVYTVSGVVTDANTGWPLYAVIDIDGYPGDPIWTDPVDGSYSVQLPEGVVYTFDVSAFSDGYLDESATVGPLTADTTHNFALDVDAACVAPGYTFGINNIFVENFASATPPALPANWAVVDTSGTSGNWLTSASTVHPSGQPPYSSPNLVYFNSYSASSGYATRLYRTAGTNLSGVSSAEVNLWIYHDTGYTSSADSVTVQVSTDGGTTWTSVGTPINRYDGSVGWKSHSVNISAYTGVGMTDVRLGLLGTSAYGNDVHVDDVAIRQTFCIAPSGGLVVGNVYDANTSAPMVGATVASAEDTATSVTTPDDPAVEDGFYTVYAADSQPITASISGGYAPDVENVTIVAGDVVEQDFYLGSGFLSTDPEALHVTIDMGISTTVPMTIANSGSAAAEFEIGESDDGFVPVLKAPPQNPSQPMMYGDASQFGTAGRNPSSGKAAAPQAPADAVSLVLDDGSQDDAIGLTAGGQFIWLNRFSPDPASFPFRLTEIQMYFGSIGVAVGETVDVYIYQDTDGDGNPGTGAVHLASLNGAAVEAVDGWSTWELSEPVLLLGPGDVLVAAVNRTAGTGSGEYPASIDQTATQGRSWVGIYTGDPGDPPTLPADDSWGTIDSFGLAGNWMIRAYGETGGGDVVWLSENPVTGTVAASDAESIDVTFDASVAEISQPGNYLATLIISNDTPYGNLTVPVTMTVVPPASYGKLEGRVTGLGYCDEDPAVLEDAEVVIIGATKTVTLTTDANGNYQYWLDSAQAPLTIHVTADEHTVGHAENVALTAGATTTQNFNLRWLEPCVAANPTALEVTLTQGYSTTLTLDLANGGPVSTSFELTELPGPTVLKAPERQVVIGDMDFGRNPNPARAATPFNLAPLAPNAVTLTHSQSQSIVANNSVACGSGGIHADNSYIRKFDLEAFGITGNFAVTNVQVGIETAVGDGGTQPATVNLYTWDSATSFTFANFTLIGTADTDVDDQDLAIIDVPVTGVAPAGSYLVVEFFTPDGQTAGNSMFVGSNALGQTDATYLAAADCGITDPTDTADIGFPDMHLVMNVIGNTGGGGEGGIPWLSEDPANGTLEADSDQTIQVTFDTLTLTLGTYKAIINVESDDPTHPDLQVPVTMYVMPPMPKVVLTPITAASNGLPGEMLTYTLHISNTGNIINTFDITAANNTWDVNVPAAPITLEAGEGADFAVVVTIPANAEEGDFDFVSVTANGTGASASSTLISSVAANPVYDVELAPAAAEQEGEAGDLITYTLRITNTGNVADIFTIEEDGATWDVTLPATPTVMLDAGESAEFTVTVAIPADAGTGAQDVTTITVTGAGGASASSQLTTRIAGYRVFLPVIFR